MPKHFFETTMFSVAMLIGTLAPMVAAAYFLYPKYQAQAQLETYTPTTSAIKISEDIMAKYRSNKSSSWHEHIPCITLKLSDAAAPLTACKLNGFIDSPEQAKQFLASNYGSASGFTVYVSPDKTKASLDGFSPERARSALLLLVLTLVMVPVSTAAMWFYMRRMVRKAPGGAGEQ